MIRNRLRSIKRAAERFLQRPQVVESENVARFKALYVEFLKNPQRFTSMDAQQLLRSAFVESKGKSLDWAWDLQRKQTWSSNVTVESRFFPELTVRKISGVVKQIQKNGYCVLPWRMPADWIDAVQAAASQLNVVSVSDKTDIQTPQNLIPKAATYWHAQPDLASIPALREFTTDPALYAVAAQYLKCRPTVDLIAAWWTFPAGNGGDSASAQLYHFDLDRIKWLKVFVYLTDVNEYTGPHAFIRGSHNTIGNNIWRDGRYSDDEVFSKYRREDEVVFTGPKGTVIIEDTLGFHKGVPALTGHRFIYEYQISINDFGYPYDALPWQFQSGHSKG